MFSYTALRYLGTDNRFPLIDDLDSFKAEDLFPLLKGSFVGSAVPHVAGWGPCTISMVSHIFPGLRLYYQVRYNYMHILHQTSHNGR